MHLSSDIYNEVESVLLAKLTVQPPALSGEQWANLCCLVLNTVPPHYVSREQPAVLSDEQQALLEQQVSHAIGEALTQLLALNQR
ncbi:late competence development ComFB family protein [Gallaecimonas sp. GXIMD1310]|uniref:late competence development ComFB family protein n=1 Tax=Gallaecimonas sp. GXIMD1310 TaxID=3131926 RepID=UPI0032558E14